MNYQKIYDSLIERAKKRELLDYKELHHIIPRCLGGDDSPENLVYLTAEEHFLAHQLLIKIYPGEYGLIYAVQLMAIHNSTNRMNNKIYGWLKRLASEAASSKFKFMWETKREDIISSMVKERNSIEGKKRMKEAVKRRWDTMSAEERNKFNKIMSEVNNRKEKIEKNRKTSKENWLNQEWKDNQLKLRTKKKQEKIENGIEIKTNSDGLKSKWKDPIWRANMLQARKLAKEKKKNETN
jgi:hypothetical protein